MHNISPSQTMARRARQLFITGMIVLLLGLLVVALAIFCYVIPLSRDPWYSTLQVGLLCFGLPVGLVGGALIVRGLTLPSDNPAAAYAAEVLARGLDYRYTFIRNISRFGLGYIDAVLVGPNGALVFYFVDRSGGYFCEGETWLVQSGVDYRPAGINPTREVVRDVNALRRYLAERNLGNMPVYAVIVFTHPRANVSTRQPVVPVAHLRNLLIVLRDNYLAEERVGQSLIDATVRAIMAG